MDQETLEKINALTRRTFKAEELYTFPVILCHNDIDRDGERFSDAALDEMAALFIGKTGIFDHDPTAANQSARIYDTEVLTDAAKTTAWGGTYRCLKGYAYMVKTDANAALITEIDAGIKKEVSVSCSVSRKTCSVCGKNIQDGTCGHRHGRVYGQRICHTVLDGITDAYEWSFVAVPAQVGAGVTKQYNTHKGGDHMEEFIPIATRADFDTAVQPLIDAAVSAKAAEFEGWLSPEAHQQALDALKNEHKSAMLKNYREKAALLAGLPPELADRLTGDSEEEICKDAEHLAAVTRKSCGTPSFCAAEGEEFTDVEKAFYTKNKGLAPGTRKEN